MKAAARPCWRARRGCWGGWNGARSSERGRGRCPRRGQRPRLPRGISGQMKRRGASVALGGVGLGFGFGCFGRVGGGWGVVGGGGFRLFGQRAAVPGAAFLFAGSIAHRAFALAFALEEIALVDIAIGVGGDALARDLALFPFAFICEAVGHGDLALTVALAVQPLALVAIAVGIGHHPVAVVARIFERALVDHAVGIGGAPCAVDHAAAPFAFVG